jgi:hypothetical protein
MHHLAQASDAQMRIGESIIRTVVMDSGLDASHRPGMTAQIVPAPSLRTLQPHRGSSSLPLVGRVAHRERSERCAGWGCFRKREPLQGIHHLPPPALRASLERALLVSTPQVGGIRKSELRSSGYNSSNTRGYHGRANYPHCAPPDPRYATDKHRRPTTLHPQQINPEQIS